MPQPDLVTRLRDERERRLFGNALLDRAADVIERLRARFIEEATDFGYDEDEAREMLAEVEEGTP
jgi:hypothetical protein